MTYPNQNQTIHHRDDRRRIFLDTEFDDDGETVRLISIALVDEHGGEYYACNADADLTRVNPWVAANVLPILPARMSPAWRPRAQIATEVREFVLRDQRAPEIWAYFADYDWIVLAQLYGPMVALPNGFPMYCMDLKQRAVDLGSPTLPKQNGSEHDALADARWNRDVYAYLRDAL